MDDLDLPEEIALLQRSARQLIAEHLAPASRAIEERDEIPRELLRTIAEAGFFGVGIPERYGGTGFGKLGFIAAAEAFGHTNASIWNVVGGAVGLCAEAIAIGGPEAARERWLPGIARGETLGAYALSEANAGSDAASLQTVARREGEAYAIEGSKTFITNAPVADLFVIFATVDRSRGAKGITAFVVERSAPGLTVGPNNHKMGLRGSTNAQLSFADLRVPASQRLGEEGGGFAIAMRTLDLGRLNIAAHAVGQAQALLDASVAYARTRRQFGRPIGANQAVAWMLADAATEIHAARLVTYDAVRRLDRGERVTRPAAMAKLFATETLGRVADAAVQVHGGMGYMKELWIERAYRDARIARIYEGTSEIQRQVISNGLLRDV